MKLFLFVLAVIFTCLSTLTLAADFSSIPWKSSIDQADPAKPSLVLVTKSGCGACVNLKKSFSQSPHSVEELRAMGDHFNLIHLADSDNKPLPELSYVPHAVFLDKNKAVRKDIFKGNDANAKYKYFPQHINTLLEMAKKAAGKDEL